MEGLVDIYLPDFKCWTMETSKRLLKADNYTAVAMESIKAMQKQVGDLCFTSDGIAKKGVLVRHLVMPGREAEGANIVQWLAENISKDLFVMLMLESRDDHRLLCLNRPWELLVEKSDIQKLIEQSLRRS
ncbi:MAG: hypothetical protein Q9227_005818 [Pyrenula ochraceoflavens]